MDWNLYIDTLVSYTDGIVSYTVAAASGLISYYVFNSYIVIYSQSLLIWNPKG
jgi:hypothetical protein